MQGKGRRQALKNEGGVDPHRVGSTPHRVACAGKLAPHSSIPCIQMPPLRYALAHVHYDATTRTRYGFGWTLRADNMASCREERLTGSSRRALVCYSLYAWGRAASRGRASLASAVALLMMLTSRRQSVNGGRGSV